GAATAGHGGSGLACRFSPANDRAFSASGPEMKLWDAANAGEVATLPHDGAPACAFSPDGARLASLSESEARVWCATTGAPLHSMAIAGEGDCMALSQQGCRFTAD